MIWQTMIDDFIAIDAINHRSSIFSSSIRVTRLPCHDSRPYPRFWSQRNQRLRLDMLPRHELNTVAPRGQRENQQCLNDRELIADALPRSTAERQVSEARTGSHAL